MEQLLREICLEGFKSFRDKTIIKFDGPFTAIVGPNGSGKSNVVDAVKWVLGDQSPRSIRASTGLEAIFRPGDGKPDVPMGFASVAIKIDNSKPESEDEPLAYEIERRYYRSGESVYSINGRTARLRDVRAIMSRKGFGLGSLSVVSQGEIDGFLSLVPADRRLVFEDLARISDFKSNKRKILGQLENSARNLQRLQDLLGEISVRADQLSVQAEAARHHAELTGELNLVRAQLAAQEFLLAKRNLERHEERLKELAEELARVEGEKSDATSNLSQARIDLERAQSDNAAVLSECEEGRRLLDLARAEERRLIEAGGHLTTLIGAVQEEVSEREIRLGKIESRKTELEGIILRAAQDCATAHSRKMEYELYLSHRTGFMRACERERERLVSKAERLAGESTLFSRDAEFHLRRTESLSAEIDSLRAGRVELASSKDKFAVELRSLESGHQELEKERIEHRDKLTSAETALDSARTERASADKWRSELTAEIAALERERDILKELEIAREGYTEGVKAVMERVGKFRGLRGILGDLVQPVKGRENLVERILGDSIEFLVCERLDDALGIVETARKDHLGSVTCIVMELVPPVAHGTGESRFLSSSDPDIERILSLLMGSLKEVETLKGIQGADLAGILVSSDGNVFRSPAFVSGGAAGSQTPGIFTRRARLDDLHGLIEARRSEESRVADRLGVLENQIGKLVDETKSLERTVQRVSEEIKANEAETRRLNEKHERVDHDLVALDKHLKEVETDLETATENAKFAASSVESIKRVRADLKRDLAYVETELARVPGEIEDLRGRFQRAIIEEASYREEGERADSELDGIGSEKAVVGEELNKKKIKLDEVLREAQERSSELKHAVEQREALEKRLPLLEKEETAASERIDAMRIALSKAENDLEMLGARVESIEASVHQQELRLAELRGGLGGLEKELGAFPDVAERISSGELSGKEIPSKKELVIRQEETDAALFELGEVNPLAIEEELHAKSRLEELAIERDDLTGAADELRKALEEIEIESQKAFLSTFNDAKSRFTEVFSALFPGGAAELKLTDPDDPLESGIDVKVKFPEKGEMDLLQFSGGERALISLALLFAILKVKPSSFTLLDEVEAALDDVNTLKFLDYLGQEFPLRQFILITHNKITMERADRLYGVTMREAGVSQVVSVDLKKLQSEGIEQVLGPN